MIENSMVAGDSAGDWERYDGMHSTQLQAEPAPFEVGQRVEYVGGRLCGFRDGNNKPVIHVARGQRGTVVSVLAGMTYKNIYDHDSTTIHDASMVRMDRDAKGTNPIAVDADGAFEWIAIEEDET